jgi:hypothetical protein
MNLQASKADKAGGAIDKTITVHVPVEKEAEIGT